MIDEAQIPDSAKLNRLFDVCKGRAKAAIRSCAAGDPKEGYKKARRILKSRFGDEYVISEAYVSKLTTGPAIKQHEISALQDFLEDIQSCVETLSEMDMLDEIDTRSRMVKIIERLPYAIQTRWSNKATTTRRTTGMYPNIKEFLEFVEDCIEETCDPVFGIKPKSSNEDRKKKSTCLQTNQQSQSGSKQRKQVPCVQCAGNHPLFLCSKFKGLNAEERLKLVKEKACCINCLKPGHNAKDCRNQRICNTGECKEKHSFLLHDAIKGKPKEKEATSSNTMNSNEAHQQKICLPCVEVIVSSGENRFVTKALVDTGSDRTYCKTSLAQSLQLEGKKKIINMQTLHGIRPSKVEMVDFDVCDLRSSFKVRFKDVYVTSQFPCLRSSVATKRDIEGWSHLTDIPISNSEDVSLLIGQNQPEAMEIKEIRYGEAGQPYAVRYALGWTVSGPVSFQHSMQTVTTNFAIEDHALDQQVSKFFQLDHVPNINPECYSLNDKRVIQLWDETTQVIDDRYSIQLPFKEDPPNLPDNRETAEKNDWSLLGKISREIRKSKENMRKKSKR